ncbi:MAG: cytochrome c, partial [Verrucomicrobiae bacterium]|nr:cytochrome c [Verrucomicrobiae bacterium]NNJ86898.1 cytochrome c [Akkermansiaceae bacterium]
MHPLHVVIFSLCCLLFTVPSLRAEPDAAKLMLLPESALPAYEANIDHAKLIQQRSKSIIRQGARIYQQVCHSCHGDLDKPGSIPNSLRFGEGKFQHGSDPYTIYQSMTRGWRAMAPQVTLVPREKYAVIHYIREYYLKGHNKSQYFDITKDYLDSLPKGNSLGPVPERHDPWNEMNYGPFLTGTFEVTSEASRARPRPKRPADYIGPDDNIAYKAIAIRLDQGDG